jgi:hypothetical protein
MYTFISIKYIYRGRFIGFDKDVLGTVLGSVMFRLLLTNNREYTVLINLDAT